VAACPRLCSACLPDGICLLGVSLQEGSLLGVVWAGVGWRVE
jgi:hypothetical protein